MKIGATDLKAGGSNSFQKIQYFDVDTNQPNQVYRVLPPLYSLADKGMLSSSFRLHSIWLPTPKGDKNYPEYFKCIKREKKAENGKEGEKVVTQSCPMCEKNVYYTEMHKSYSDRIKALPDGEQKEGQQKLLNDFLKQKVFATGSKSENYLNVMRADGKLGILRLSYKHFMALKVRLTELQSQYHIDATGMTGIFLTFNKISPKKGSIDVTFVVDAVMETVMGTNGIPSMSFKYHQIDQALIDRMSKECKDLSLLFENADLTYDQIKSLADSFDDKAQLIAVASSLFKKSATPATELSPAAPAASTIIAPLAAPVAPLAAPVAPLAAPLAAPVAPLAAPLAAPVAPLAAPTQAPAGMFGSPSTPQGGLSNVSDDEFAQLFG